MGNNFEKNKKKVSIVIPSWFLPEHCGKYGKYETWMIASICLKRMLENTPRELVEYIIIDNGSRLTDDEVLDEFLNPNCSWKFTERDEFFTPSEYFAQADILIKNTDNLGFGKAMNQGIALSRCPYIVAANNDIVVWDGWVESMIKDFESNNPQFEKPIGALMSNLIKSCYQTDCLNEKGRLDFYKSINLKKEQINLPHKDIKEPGAEMGSFFMFTKELANKISNLRDGYQFYDEDYKVGFGEDRNLWKEMRMLGYETYRTSEFRTLHVGGCSMSKIKNEPEIRKMIDNNRIILKERWNNK